MEDFVAKLTKPRAAWVMVPAGDATDKTVMKLASLMSAGMTSSSTAAIRISRTTSAAARLSRIKGFTMWMSAPAAASGASTADIARRLIRPGPDDAVKQIDPILKTLVAPGIGDVPRTPGFEKAAAARPETGLPALRLPPARGHFVKMVHNGIEYGLMQAFAEGFDILRSADSEGGDRTAPS